MPSTPAIDADGLHKEYGDTVALDQLDLSIPQGTVYGFLGPNGAGKTTTMQLLTTLTKPTSGTAHIMGASIADRGAVIPHIGFLPEEPPLFDELTGREQLDYFADLRELPRDHADERIETLLDRFDLVGDAGKRISAYSKGMKQKLGLIQAILHDPEVVFLDEPTSGLDPRAARTVRDTIADLTDGNTTVFLSTHILPVVDELADTVGVLYDGRIVAEGPPQSLKQRADADTQQTLEDVFLEVTQSVDYAASGTGATESTASERTERR